MKRSVSGPRYLAIETSSPRLSLALGDESKILASFTGPLEWRHADTLFEGMQALLRRQKWPVQSLSGVAVSIGPGSFTGIRIGLAAARALGQSLRIPVVGTSALEILAAGAPASAEWRAPQIDALRDQIFTGLFQRQASGAVKRAIAETMTTVPEWKKILRHKVGRSPVWISPLQGCYPEAGTLLVLAQKRFAKTRKDSYKTVLPLYIRKSAAEERRG